MKDTKVLVNRQTGRLIAKNVIIFVVLIAVCSLSIWAWFTQNTTATADGINIIAKSEGVKVSWDGKDYYDNLTALEDSAVEAEKTGLAKNICNKDGTPYSLNLISGNGLKFFEPYLNRRTGTVLTNSDGSWSGFDVTNSPEGKYIDIDLYFRGDNERDIYLAGNSKVDPKSTTDRISDFGPFSKDYIAAASRVAFFNVTKITGDDGKIKENRDCSFIWAPNANVELVENENGYTKVTEFKEDTDSSGSSSGGNLNGGALEDGNTYYLWTIAPNANYSSGTRQITNSYLFEYDENISYYVAEFTVTVPSYQSENPSIPFLISQSGTSPLTNTFSFDRSASFSGNDGESLLKVSNQGYNAATFNNTSISENKCGQFYMTKTNTLIQGTQVDVKFGFNPQTGVVTVLGYEGNDSWSKGGTEVPVDVKYYEIENNTTCALVNPKDSVAVSSAKDNNKKSVHFKDSSTKLNVMPVSITTAEQFTAEKTGDGYAATYKFKNTAEDKYLTINNGEISYTAAGSAFSLYYSSEHEGPLLKSGEYYLVVDGGVVKAVKLGDLDYTEAVTVYTGSSYQLNTELTSEGQTYQYYDADTNKLVTLNESSTPKLFTTTQTMAGTVKVGNTKIATLAKENEDDEYYTAHIVMRVWVEGTDREAQTPLADGIFNMSLHFTSQ